MRVHIVDREVLTFGRINAPDVDLRVDSARVEEILLAAEANLADPGLELEHPAWAVVATLARAIRGQPHKLTSQAIEALGGWLKEDAAGAVLFWYLLRKFCPEMIFELSGAVLAARPASVADVFQAALMAPDEICARCQRRLAIDSRDSVREHYFALLGKHRRLLPPGAISTADFAPEVLADVLRAGITDAVPAVRERAIAVAIGMNVVRVVRDEVLRCLDHEHEGVRQYAIVALGTLDDSESLARIVDKLDTGTQPEMTSAIWALARRPDGLVRVLTLATDPRDWVRTELLYALAGVAAPMTDEQIAALTQAITDERLSQVIERHLDRTRRGAPEYGPDGGLFVVRAAGDAKQAAKPK